jgi:putative transposase
MGFWPDTGRSEILAW